MIALATWWSLPPINVLLSRIRLEDKLRVSPAYSFA